MDYVIGIDIGTTSVKVLIMDAGGLVTAKADSGYDLLLPKNGWVEQDAGSMWQAICSAMIDALKKFKFDRRSIRAISLSTQRDTLVCVDEKNRPVRNMITWMDSRSVAECEALSREFGESRVYEITGVTVSPIWTLAFILWLRNNEKKNFEATSCFALVHDYVMMRLGAKGHFLDSSNACQTMLYDFRQGVWSVELMEYAGLTEEKLPVLVEPGSQIGTIDPVIAAEFGLSNTVVLIAGGGDQQCAATGAGAALPGDVEIGIGTAGNILAMTESPLLDPAHRMICHRAALTGLWVLEGAMLATGKVIAWLQDTIYEGMSLKNIDDEITIKSAPGAGGLALLPHFEGAACPYWNPRASGVLFGLSLSSKQPDIARAVLEGVCFEIRKNIDLLAEWNLKPTRVLVSGGAARSALWMKMLADILALEVCVPAESDCAALGAALLAAYGCGIIKTIEEFMPRLSASYTIYSPDREICAVYEPLYAKNSALYRAIEAAGLYRK
jgi:D-xylulose kinase